MRTSCGDVGGAVEEEVDRVRDVSVAGLASLHALPVSAHPEHRRTEKQSAATECKRKLAWQWGKSVPKAN